MTPDNQSDPWVAVAVVLRPHGLDGTMRLKPLTGQDDDLLQVGIRQFRVRNKGRVMDEPLTLRDGTLRQGLLYVHFEGIHDRTAAEKFTNCDLVIPEDERWDLPAGEYYADDLVGLEVRDEAGKPIGKVLRADNGSAHDYLILSLEGVKAKETMLPLLPDFVPLMNIADGFVEVRIPEGLLD
ncbi:ribosome maturation factor RimM [bacterium]|nr:ribosome maturation factor RimM [bacterium]